MKSEILFVFVALSLFSCSGSDDNGPVETITKDLKEIATYIDDGDAYLIDQLKIYQNNRLTERYIYGDDFLFSDLYTYDQNGRLIHRIAGYEDYYENTTIQYDNQGRISSIEIINGNIHEQKVFDYSVPGKILMEMVKFHDSDPFVQQFFMHITYDLNNEGLVYRITKSDDINLYEVNEVEYTGNNITSKTFTHYDNEIGANVTQTYNYSYDMETPVKGHYLNKEFNQFGSNPANHVLYFEDYVAEKDKYLISSSYEYEFDSDGYPVKKVYHIFPYEKYSTITYQ